jgi:L-arabinose isomerase
MAYLIGENSFFGSPALQQVEQQLAKAKTLFETFAGSLPTQIQRKSVARSVPDVMVDLGALRGVIYTKDHQGCKQTYIHFMDHPPRLLCDSDGRQLYVHGGSYRITRRGIEG